MARACLIAALAVMGCATTQRSPVEQPRANLELRADLHVRELEPGLWLHVSSKELPGFGRVPSNGLVVLGPDGALLIDTPWTPEQTKSLVEWIGRTHSLERVIVTHSHEDRTGGVSEIPNGVSIHALGSTAELSAELGRAFAPKELEAPAAKVGGVETFFPGAGHAPDNVVVWLPEHHLLFGGCFVKAGGAKDLGNIADADLQSWGGAVQRVIERYPTARVVIPGHGELGGPELLSHTAALIQSATEAPRSP